MTMSSDARPPLYMADRVERGGRTYYLIRSQCSAFPWWVCWADRGMETLPNGRELRRLSPYTGESWNVALENAVAGERENEIETKKGRGGVSG